MFGGLVQDAKKIFGGITTVFKGIGTMLKGIFSGDAETALKGFQTAAGGIVDTPRYGLTQAAYFPRYAADRVPD